MFPSIYIFLSIFFAANVKAANNPVVLVPGVGGSQIEIKATNAVTNCQKTTNGFMGIWANPLYINGILGPCLNDYLKLNWINGKSSNAQGVEVRVKEFDKVSSVERLSDVLSSIESLHYFKKVSDTLVSKGKLQKDVTIRGAPYDWRKSLSELNDYFQRLQKQVEDAYVKGGNTRVVMVGHSLGCLVVTKFLQTRTQTWKDKHIASFVSVNGPYGGAVKSLLAVIHGYNLDISLLPASQLRQMQRTFLTTYLLLPSRLAFHPDFPIFFGPSNKKYTLTDLENGNIFKAINYAEGIDLHNKVKSEINLNQVLGVKLHCVIGDGIKTVNSLKIDAQHFPDKLTEMFYGGGDGTVNAESLKLCQNIKGAKEVQTHYFEGGEHMGMIKSDKFANLLVDIISNKLPRKTVIYYDDHDSEEN